MTATSVQPDIRPSMSTVQHWALTALTYECAHRYTELYQAYRHANYLPWAAQSKAKMQLAREYHGFYRTLYLSALEQRAEIAGE